MANILMKRSDIYVNSSAAREPYGTSGNTYLAEWNTSRTLARRYYEMTDHLGNVLATVLDRKTGAGADGSGSLYDHWVADLASTADANILMKRSDIYVNSVEEDFLISTITKPTKLI